MPLFLWGSGSVCVCVCMCVLVHTLHTRTYMSDGHVSGPRLDWVGWLGLAGDGILSRRADLYQRRDMGGKGQSKQSTTYILVASSADSHTMNIDSVQCLLPVYNREPPSFQDPGTNKNKVRTNPGLICNEVEYSGCKCHSFATMLYTPPLSG